MIRTAWRGAGLAGKREFPKGRTSPKGLSEKSPAGHPPPHRRDGIAWERGRPARILFLITWERGRPARILFLWLPLSFSAMLQAATLSAGTAAARPKESHGAVPG